MIPIPRRACRRRRIRHAMGLALLLAAQTAPAFAEDLPAALTAAAAQFGKPGTNTEMPCQGISGWSNQGPPRSTPDEVISVLPTEEYSSDTVGVYLGYSPVGGTPSPFVQVLVEAGIAKPVPLT